MNYSSKTGLPAFLFRGLLLFCAVLCAAAFCACGKGGYREAAYAAAAPAGGSAAPGAPAMARSAAQNSVAEMEETADFDMPADAEALPAGENAAAERKLVKSAELRLRAEDPAAMEKPVMELMRKYGAWPASTGVYENSRNYSIRVPSASYDAMLAELAGLGRLLGRTENAEDVTLRYYDLEGRLATRQELLKTYRSYLGKAANIEEIMEVESRIADLQYEIDRTGSQFRSLANLVDYSTINMEILGPATSYSYSEPTLGERLKALFGSFGDTASSALVALTGIVIYGIPGILVLMLLFSLLFGRIGLLKKLWRFAAGKKGGQSGKARAAEESPSDKTAGLPE